MNKRGQVYLFAAVVISIMIFGLTITYNKLEQRRISEDFKRISDNYNLESATFLNALIETSILSDLSTKFAEFSAEFSSYAKSKSPNYELFYVYAQDNKLYVGNFLVNTIHIPDPNNQNIDLISREGCYLKLNANIELGGLTLPSSIELIDIGPCIDVASISPSVTSIDVCIIDAINSEEFCYTFDLTKGKPQVMIVTGETELEQRQVYIGGKGFIKGRKK